MSINLSLLYPPRVSTFTGNIKLMNMAPAGWLTCDGSAVSRTTFANLFSVIGTTYGAGDGSTTFNVPEMRGRNPMGAGSGPGLSTRSLGQTGGEERHSLTISTTPSHTHTALTRTSGTWSGTTNLQGAPGGAPYQRYTDTFGSNGSHNNVQPYRVFKFMIKT